MDKITLEQDLKVLYVTASSFPAGIMQAHKQLHMLVPPGKQRRYFGISRPENNGGIVYKAAAEELEDHEAVKLNCETMLIKKGMYLSVTLNDFTKDPASISRTFEKILEQPGLDPQGYCVEVYSDDNKSVHCMVRLLNT